MKTIKIWALIALFVGFTSCSEDDDGPTRIDVESDTFDNLFAPQAGGQGQGPISGEFVRFDFESGSTTSSTTDWDIAFRGTTIIINGGESLGTTDEPERTGDAAAYIEIGVFDEITTVDTTKLSQDNSTGYAIPTGGGNGWYNYIPFPANLITPIAGRVIVLRTRNGKYVKMEILSYYKDAPLEPDSSMDEPRYYTFNYVFNPNEGETTF